MTTRRPAAAAGGVVRAGVLAAGTTLTVINAASSGYLGVLTLAGIARRRPSPPSGVPPSTRFVIMVPAHDEEAVIADALESMTALRYDRTMYDVHVVADNCSDRTSDIVRSCGWTVHERIAPDDPGKGPALNWLFDRLDRAETTFDVAIVVDADTVLDAGFLTAMDATFIDGASVAQGFYSVRDPGTSSAAGLRYAALAARHHLRPLGRGRIGASCGLYGNGMAFRRDVLRRQQWSGHLVEDAEFQLGLLLRDGTRVRYVSTARLEAEMPNSLEAAASQNERWERGRSELMRRFGRALVARAALGGPARRVVYADALADLLLPPLSVLAVLQATGATLNVVRSASRFRRSGRRQLTRRSILGAAMVLALPIHVITALHAVGAPASVYQSLGRAPRMILWKVNLWVGALRSTNEITWRRTRRNAET